MKTQITELLDFKNVANALRASGSVIIEEWVQRVLARIPAASREDRLSLIDSIPLSLELLANGLDGTEVLNNATSSKDVAREHGEQRADLGSYSIEQVVTEYQVLREVLTEKLHSHIESNPIATAFIHRFIDQGIRQAAGRFALIEKQNHSALTASIEVERRRLEDVFQQSPIAMVLLMGKELRYTLINEPALVLARRTREDLLGKTFYEASKHNHIEVARFAQILDRVFCTGVPFSAKELNLKRPLPNGDIEELWVDLSYYPYFQNNEIVGVITYFHDSTGKVLARKQIEESERKSKLAQQQLNLALESARMGAWTLNFDTGEVTYSDIMAEISGVPTTVQTTAENAAKFVHPEDLERVRETFRTAIANRTEYFDEYRIVRPNGAVRWIFCRGTITSNSEDVPMTIAGLFGDITERKNNETALLAEQGKLETIFQVSPACMALWTGPDFVFSKVNSEYQRLFDDRELLGKPLLEAIPELEGQPFPALLTRVLETGESLVAHEALVKLARKKDGPVEDRYFDFSYVRVHDPQGHPFGIYGHAIDVTERVQGRKQLSASQNRLKIATESARIGTFIFDPQNMTFSLSSRSCEILGLDEREFYSLNELAEVLLSEDDESFKKQINRLLDPTQPGALMVDNKVILPNGEIRYVFTTAQHVVEEDVHGKRVASIIGTHMDITERVRLKQDLEKAKVAADQANHSKSAFLANMSHEIRTPLGAILGFSALLKEAALAPEERDRYIDTIVRNGTSLTHIIDDILDLAKVEAGRLDVETVNFSIYDLMTDVVDLFRDKAKQKRIYVLLNVDENLPLRLSSDPTRLRQILINLIGNAVKFTESGGVRVNVRAKQLTGSKVTIEIAVKDTGIGLTQEQRQRLFQPFVQADNSTTRKFGGTGLGLVLSQRLSQALGGQISIDDDCEKGCTFTLTFNATIPSGTIRPSGKKTLEIAKDGALQDVRVLVVDDSLDNQFLVTHLLTKNGARVETASDGREALEKAIVGDHDVVLMDIQMPTMDGYQAKKALDARGYPKPVIALTAHAMAEERMKTRTAGFAGHLTKPLAAEELIHTVAQLAKHIAVQ